MGLEWNGETDKTSNMYDCLQDGKEFNGVTIDISYTLDGVSHTVGRRKLMPDRRRCSFPLCWYH